MLVGTNISTQWTLLGISPTLLSSIPLNAVSTFLPKNADKKFTN